MNLEAGKFAVVITPTLREVRQITNQEIPPTVEWESAPHQRTKSMNCVIWNCRGAQSSEFIRNFRSLLNYYQPPLVVLLETHLMDHNLIKEDFIFTNLSQAPATGQAWGIVVLWNEASVNTTKLIVTNQAIHCMVQVCSYGQPFLFSAIYASTLLSSKTALWDNLMHIANFYKGPWIIGGDILYATEKFGGCSLNNNRADMLFNCLNYCQLIDLGFSGSKYTWINKRKRGALILKRLDRIVANIYPEAHVSHLPRTHSDHCSLLLTFHNNRPSTKDVF